MDSPTGLEALSLHYIGEQGLLLDAGRERLYALNACAAFVWSRLKGGASQAEAERALIEQFALPVETAASYVRDALRQYESLSSGGGEVANPEPQDVHPRRHAWPIAAEALAAYSLLDSECRVHFSDRRLFETINPLLRHLASKNCRKTKDVVDIAITSAGNGVLVVSDRQVIGEADGLETAAALVRACLTQIAVARSGALCAVHASALCRNEAALLLPGEAGHGKSTLSGGLATCGFEMLCDDTALLTGEPLQVRSMRNGLCVKRGAYRVLEHRYPQLHSLPEWRRPDGQWVRYLLPDRDLRWANRDAGAVVRWIVFPHYRPDRGTALVPLAKHEALARLLRGVYFLSGKLDGPNLDKLVAWLDAIDCFELPLASLDDAEALLDRLCA
jgi:hypothetical protein